MPNVAIVTPATIDQQFVHLDAHPPPPKHGVMVSYLREREHHPPCTIRSFISTTYTIHSYISHKLCVLLTLNNIPSVFAFPTIRYQPFRATSERDKKKQARGWKPDRRGRKARGRILATGPTKDAQRGRRFRRRRLSPTECRPRASLSVGPGKPSPCCTPGRVVPSPAPPPEPGPPAG